MGLKLNHHEQTMINDNHEQLVDEFTSLISNRKCTFVSLLDLTYLNNKVPRKSLISNHHKRLLPAK